MSILIFIPISSMSIDLGSFSFMDEQEQPTRANKEKRMRLMTMFMETISNGDNKGMFCLILVHGSQRSGQSEE